MKKIIFILFLFLFQTSILIHKHHTGNIGIYVPPQPQPPVTDTLWSVGYYAGWLQGNLAPAAVNFSAFNVVCYFSVYPNSSTPSLIDSTGNTIHLSTLKTLTTNAHSNNGIVLITIGGAGSLSNMQAMGGTSYQTPFIHNLMNFMRAGNANGIDVDWEPIEASDSNAYGKLVDELHDSLATFNQKHYLTTAIGWNSPEINVCYHHRNSLDKIGIMTYEIAGAWSGWKTWHNSALHNLTCNIASRTDLSCDSIARMYFSAGIDKGKIMIGDEWEGVRWQGGSGVSTLCQTWTSAPTTYFWQSYNTIMSSYYSSGDYTYDNTNGACYLSHVTGNASTSYFLSYSDSNVVKQKLAWIKQTGIGGMITWTIQDDHNQELTLITARNR